jgi:hypothetical protein
MARCWTPGHQCARRPLTWVVASVTQIPKEGWHPTSGGVSYVLMTAPERPWQTESVTPRGYATLLLRAALMAAIEKDVRALVYEPLSPNMITLINGKIKDAIDELSRLAQVKE